MVKANQRFGMSGVAMSNIQKFEDAFAVNFPIDVADQILGHMQNLYGDLFDKRYRNTDSEELKQTLCMLLNDVSPDDLNRGIKRMNKEKWCPTLPEFAEWCVDDGHWWTADIAWAKALNWESDKSKEISKLAKSVLDEVRQIMKAQGQNAAYKAFVDLYNTYLKKARSMGRVQIMWIEPKAIEQNENHQGIPCPPDLAEKIKSFRVGKPV